MAPRFPSIPEPGNDPATQLNTLRVIKQVVELLAANATGDKNPSGPGQGAQIFALQEDVKRLMQQEAAARSQADDGNKKDITWTVEEAVADLNKDISDARNRAIQARADALQALDEFENGTFLQTVYDINQEIGDAKGQISEKYGLSVEADKVLSGRIAKSAAYVGLNEATWKEGDLSVATRFSAMSTGYKNYIARTGDDFLASYTSHVVTTTDFTSAVTTKLDQLEAKLTVPSTPGRNPLLLSSAILTESNLTTDATKKIATAQNLQTTIASLTDVEGKNGATTNGAITAAVKVESDARVKLVNGVDGALDTKLKNIYSTAQYSVAVTTTGPAGPAITGFRAVSDSSGSTPISDFQIFADKFKVTNGATSKQVFTVDTLRNQVGIDGDLIVTGTIDSPSIKGGAISTVDFKPGGSEARSTLNVVANRQYVIIASYIGGQTAGAAQSAYLDIGYEINGQQYLLYSKPIQALGYGINTRNIVWKSYNPFDATYGCITGFTTELNYIFPETTAFAAWTATTSGSITFWAHAFSGATTFTQGCTILVLELKK